MKKYNLSILDKTGLALIGIGYLYILYQFSLFDSSFEDKLDIIPSVSRGVANFFVLNGLFLLFRNKLTLFWAGAILVLGVVLGRVDFFQEVIHPLLTFLVPSNSHIANNPQYAKIITTLVVFSCLLFKFLFLKGRKTFSGVFTLLTLGVVIVTTFIFHKVIVYGSLQDLERVNKETIKVSFLLEGDIFQQNCVDKNLICLVKKDKKVIFENLTESGSFLKKARFEHDRYEESGGRMIDGMFYRYQLISQKTESGVDKLIVDIHNLRRLNEQNQIYFYFLSFCAHFFWLNFLFCLIYFHRKRKSFVIV